MGGNRLEEWPFDQLIFLIRPVGDGEGRGWWLPHTELQLKGRGQGEGIGLGLDGAWSGWTVRLGDSKVKPREGRRWRKENATLSHKPSVCSLLTKAVWWAYDNIRQALCSLSGDTETTSQGPALSGSLRTKAPGKVYKYCLS